ncbi:MAG: ATP-binding cassette domain-containing protein [Deltaproteobacteria bacterium]|jgi:putative ABC transport system ATP-binding protein|nr:ATP-binding cassette domain-containing protein [Deltaproteobacteria bacterium]
MDNILEINSVSKIYGDVKALVSINLHVPPGQWLAIMGPSGSGKTTLMNIIGCLDTPSTGQVILSGLNLGTLSHSGLTAIRREAIGLIFQEFHLISYLTALENVMVAQYYHSLVDEKEALEALARVGLGERAKHLPRQLSGGEQQRVCIARALINHPQLILADEPTGNLDETNEKLVMSILHQLHSQGSTIVVVTHAPEVASHAERVIVLEHGRLASDEMNPAENSLGSQADGSQADGSQGKGSQGNGSQGNGSQADGSQGKGSQGNGSQDSGSRPQTGEVREPAGL